MPKWTNVLSLQSALLILSLAYPSLGYGESYKLLLDKELSAYARLRTVVGMDEGGIKKFAEPTILLRGTAEEIGLDKQKVSSFLGMKFLNDFAFLQSDFAFDKTYQTWEIGLFECEAWTVGINYPIAFHVQCAGGSMDEPRQWHYAILGYGPKDKIIETVRKTLDSIVQEYATFVRRADGKIEP
jgi:hypothetical protein